MAGGPIGNMVIKVDLDGSGFNKGVSGLKRQMRSVTTEMTANLSAFDKTDKSIEKLETTYEGLEKQYKVQEELVKEQKKRYDELASAKDGNKAKTEAAMTAYNREISKLKELEGQLESVQKQVAVERNPFTTLGRELTAAGDQMQAFGGGLQTVGNNLTKYITVPVLGAVSALGALTAGMGWKRLMDQDTATASLLGRGMSQEQVDAVMVDVTEGVTGGLATRAQGTRIASGALAAGIEEGEDLQNYIKLVDSFAAGSGRDHDSAAMIFNRIVGGGRLMTQELNMIEESMPGFERTMADSLGVAQTEFRELVTAGEVSSQQFLDVMQDFAGPMAEEYAKTLPGLMMNTRANIGILGERMMEGVYDQAKDAVGDFLEFLRSDDLREAASSLGEILGSAVERIINGIRTLIDWWNDADDSTRKWVLGIGALVVALGPLLTILGTGIVIFGKVAVGLGAISTVVGQAGGPLRALGRGFRTLTNPLRIIVRPLGTLVTRFGALMGPVGWVISGIALLTTGFIYAYRNSETFRNGVDRIVDSVKRAWEWITDFKDGIVSLFQGDLEGATDIFESLGLSEGTIEKVKGYVETLVTSFERFKIRFEMTMDSIKASADRIWTALGVIFTNVWNDYIKPALDWLMEGIEDLLDFLGIEMPSLDDLISGAFSAGTFAVEAFSEVIEALLETADRVFSGVASALEKIGEGDWQGAWEEVKDMFSDVGEIWNDAWEAIKTAFDEHFGDTIESAKEWAIDLWNKVKEWFSIKSQEVINTLIHWYLNVLNWWDNLKSNVSTKAQELWDNVKTWFVTKSEEITGTVRGWVGNIVTRFNSLKRNGIQAIKDLWTKGKEWFEQLKTDAVEVAKGLVEDVTGWFDDLPDNLHSALVAAGEWLDEMRKTLGDKAASLGYRISDKVVETLNTFIDGINRVAELLGLSSDLITRIPRPKNPVSDPYPNNSTGTVYYPGGPTWVGDIGPGNSPGGSGVMDASTTRELIRLPDRTEFLADGNLLLDLPPGSRIFNNRDTENELKKRMLGADFAGGTDDGIHTGWDAIKYLWKEDKLEDTVKATGKIVQYQAKQELLEMGSFVADVWDYVRSPEKLVESMLGSLNYGDGIPNQMLSFVMAAVGKLAGTATNFVKGLFDRSSNVDGGHILGKSISHPFGTYNAAAGSLLFGHRHYGIDTRHNYDPLYSPINGQVTNRFYDGMAGNILQITQGNGLHWWFAHLSEILKSVGDTVRIGDRIATTGNTGAFTTGPHLHTQVMKGGIGNRFAFDPMPLLSGSANSHRDGGYIESDGLFNLHANEMVIPLDNPTYAQKLIALAGKKMAGKSKQTRELPNIAQSDNNDKLLAATIEQNGILLKMLEKLTGIEAKDLKIGDDDIGQANDRYSARQSSKQSVTTGRMRYV